jgi:hypothetical protein
MPKDIDSGQVVWYERTLGSLIGRAETFNIGMAVSGSFSCPDPCSCPPSFSNGFLSPGSLTSVVGDYGQPFLAMETDINCSGQTLGPFNVSGTAAWSSTNTSVATVAAGGYVSCLGVGQGTIKAAWTGIVYGGPPSSCTPIQVNPNPGGGVTVVLCERPTGESTMSTGWDTIAPSKHKWVQRLLPITTSFNGRTVTEQDPGGGGPDTCWFPHGNRDPFTAVTGGTWQVNSANEWGADTVGWSPAAVTYYRAQGRAPCNTQFMQRMVINCPEDPTGNLIRPYVTQQLGAGIGTTTVSSTRAGQTQTRTYP